MPTPPDLPHTPTDEVPGFSTIENIGAGQRCVFYRARDNALHHDLALKIPRSEGWSATDSASFEASAQIVASLQHPGVPRAYCLGTLPDGRPFLAMELIEGRNLAEVLAERSRPIVDRIRFLPIFEQICQIVAHAHLKNVIHGNLRSDCAIIGNFKDVHVLGWGSALRHGNAEPQGVGGNRSDYRTDTYALGMILLEILSGASVPEGNSLNPSASDLSAEFAKLSASGEDADLIAIARSCLTANPNDRPADAGELAARISTYRANLEERIRKNQSERFAFEAVAVEKGKLRQFQLALLLVVGMFVIWIGATIWYQSRSEALHRILAEAQQAERTQANIAAERAAFAATQQKARELQKQKLIERERAAKAKSHQQPTVPIVDERIAPMPREIGK